ncbi:MAG TPA: monovalent cation/H+ antiporter complex subunit F [Burkholderiales bacterium]|jgi:multicomponent Na+:H+ antiporter subunit F
MFAAAILGILVALALVLVRALRGPTVFDRLLAGNTVGTLAVLALSVVGFLNGRPEFLDLAIVYALLNVIGTIAVLKFFQYGDLGDPGEDVPR